MVKMKKAATQKIWGKPTQNLGTNDVFFAYDAAGGKELISKFMKKHINSSVWIQLGTNGESDFNLPWLRYWHGVLVKIISDKVNGGDFEYSREVMNVFLPPWVESVDPESYQNLTAMFSAVASKGYVHACLKKFFPQLHDENDIPIKKSFAKDGVIGEEQIKTTLPHIQRWCSRYLDIYIPEKGEYLDEKTGELKTYDLSLHPYNYSRDEEKKLWDDTKPHPSKGQTLNSSS